MAPVTIMRSREWWNFHRRMRIEMDGKRVGGIWNGSVLKIDVPAGPHTFRAFLGWVGSKPLPVDVREGSVTALGVRASWHEAAEATASYRPMGPQAYGVGRYPNGMPDEGLEIWEYLASSE